MSAMMKKSIPIFLACALLAGIGGNANEKLTITGSSTIAPMMSDLAKAFEKNHPDTRVDVQSGGSSRGISDTRNNLAKLGMVSRSLKADESDLKAYNIAIDGLAIIVNASNPIKVLSKEQVAAIYTGKINNWKEVGGYEAPILRVHKAEGRSTLELFLNFFELKNQDIKASIVIGDNEQGIKSVSNDVNAIGYVSIGAAEYNQEAGVPIKLLPYKGVAAKSQNVENGSYALIRELNMISKSEARGLSKNFLNFIMSEQAIPIIKEHYFVPVATR